MDSLSAEHRDQPVKRRLAMISESYRGRIAHHAEAGKKRPHIREGHNHGQQREEDQLKTLFSRKMSISAARAAYRRCFRPFDR
jgi:hypothetical protein